MGYYFPEIFQFGKNVPNPACGAQWGYRMWIRWLRESRESLSVQCELELMSQWESFAHHPGGLDGLLRLKCLVRRDNTRAAWETFLQHEREADHRDRHSTNPISASMGSLTHMDLAKFVWHQLNETMQCTSTAGRGMWYVYKQRDRCFIHSYERNSDRDHRWVFDKDGPTVLVECHRILRDETEKMRSLIVPRAPPPSTGIGHSCKSGIYFPSKFCARAQSHHRRPPPAMARPAAAPLERERPLPLRRPPGEAWWRFRTWPTFPKRRTRKWCSVRCWCIWTP